MPRYDFFCHACGVTFEDRCLVGEDWSACPDCGGDARRQFGVTRNLVVPAYFRETRGWHLPDKEDKQAWENIERNRGAKPEPTPTLKQEIETNIDRYRTGRMPVEEFREMTREAP